MKPTTGVLTVMLTALGLGLSVGQPLPADAAFTTLSITPLAIEGLTGDDTGTLYTTGRAAQPGRCPVWRIDASGTTPLPVVPVQIGSIPNAAPGCNPSGITRDDDGNFYIADANQGGVIWKLTNADMNPVAPFAIGVPGTNGIAFDRDGNLWTGDGTTGQGRVWKISPTGIVTEMFRIQPMRNSTALGATIAGDGVGRQVRTFPPGTLTITVPPSAAPTIVTPAGGQDLVANGVAFNRQGDLFVSDTARGAIWKVEFDADGTVTSGRGCDTTFTANTLCLENIFAAHPLLEGTDGIALDRAGNIWNAANERNAIVVVTKQRQVVEIFRNPPNAAGLRNSADTSFGDNHILEFPTSPFLTGRTLCVANSDGNRRDNSPNTAGEINSAGPIGARGKVSCMDNPLQIAGLPLPVR
jgi:sugar lactone lactonase YvrE